jgi:DNA polymerase-3 subunit delta'
MTIKDKMVLIDPPWLKALERELVTLVERGQCPQALLLYGNYGTGRRYLSRRLAACLLGSEPEPAAWFGAAEAPRLRHPDLFELAPAEGKRSVSVDQVRELIKFVQLTSHQHGAKVISVYPADAMTSNAANSLLKTLEEPPPETVLILVTEALSRLPATVVSRCRRVRVSAPTRTVALDWLQQVVPSVDWPPVLDLAGGAPFLGLELLDSGLVDRAAEFSDDLDGLIQRRISPVTVARRWTLDGYPFSLRWLYWRASALIREQLDRGLSEPAGNLSHVHLQTAAQDTHLEAWFEYLQAIGDLRRLQSTGINAELNLARLLTAWYGGFHGFRVTGDV